MIDLLKIKQGQNLLKNISLCTAEQNRTLNKLKLNQ
ncbi:hypothetical protein FHX64_002758 [Microbacter margulisiae]|uniref:Uncharacterized protein n=1 Tax=Microbacter margulisiae TaxID=1350067 RepID=A0A7W5DT31_9PORP|nr:hypothetical protein [Microbacter margulisiae]